MSKVTELPKTWTVTEVAEHLQLSETKVRQLIASKELPHYRIGNRIRVTQEHLNTYLSAVTVTS